MLESQEASIVDMETCEAMRREEWEVLEVSCSLIESSWIICWTEVYQVHIPRFPLEKPIHGREMHRARDPSRTLRGIGSEGHNFAFGRTGPAGSFLRRLQYSVRPVTRYASASYTVPSSPPGLSSSPASNHLWTSRDLWVAVRRKAGTA